MSFTLIDPVDLTDEGRMMRGAGAVAGAEEEADGAATEAEEEVAAGEGMGEAECVEDLEEVDR